MLQSHMNIKNLIPKNIKEVAKSIIEPLAPAHFYGRTSYSQEGEDLLLARYTDSLTSGFYVDIGAHHPFRYSNTYYFYQKGWHGINIDILPGCMRYFDKVRPRDINLEIGISEKEETLTYYQFDEPAINGFNKDLSQHRVNNSPYKIIAETPVTTMPLAAVLDQYLPKQQPITFFSIDVEGLDLAVLKSNNWDKYKPAFILVEALNEDISHLGKDELSLYLHTQRYQLSAKTKNTCLFELEQ